MRGGDVAVRSIVGVHLSYHYIFLVFKVFGHLFVNGRQTLAMPAPRSITVQEDGKGRSGVLVSARMSQQQTCV